MVNQPSPLSILSSMKLGCNTFELSEDKKRLALKLIKAEAKRLINDVNLMQGLNYEQNNNKKLALREAGEVLRISDVSFAALQLKCAYHSSLEIRT